MKKTIKLNPILILKRIIIIAVLMGTTHIDTKAQGRFGNTLNVGIGIGGYAGYYHYVGRSLSVVNINYEFDVAKNFTLAPFVSIATYSNRYYWGDKNHPERYYSYRETIIPVGVKGTYYFDNLVKASSKWDFYGAGSLGFAVINSRWESGYYGDKNYYRRGNPLFLDLHLGAEYHLAKHIGMYLDVSTGVSTLGLSFK